MGKHKSDVIRLRHMIDAITKALRFSKNKSRGDLNSDEQLVLALVRLVEIIGEAASKVSEDMKERNKEIPWRKIIGTRNRLIHAYDEIDLDILWQIIFSDLPQLLKQLENILPFEERNEQQNLFDN